jgi:hypothetical protein
MSIHFEYGPNEKASLRKLVGLCDVALALIRERRQLLKLLRENPGSEKRNNVVSATLERLQDLEQVSHLIQLAFRDPVGNKDGGGAVEAVGEDERGTLVLHSAPAIPQQSAGPIMHRDGESTAHNARGEKPETEVGGLFQDPNDGKSAIRTGFRQLSRMVREEVTTRVARPKAPSPRTVPSISLRPGR